MSMPLI